jgi:hypothetical protein
MATTENNRDSCALESIGHLTKKVCLMWGSPELDVFISRLMMDSRGGQRQGLPMAVGAELLFLAQTNKIIRAIDLIGQQKISMKEAYLAVDEGDQRRLEADEFDNPLVSRDTILGARADERRSEFERREVPRASDSARRSGFERRESVKASGSTAMFGQFIFKVLTSKAAIFLIVFAITIKLLWSYIAKFTG